MCSPSGGSAGAELLSFWHRVLREEAASTAAMVGGFLLRL